MQGVKRIAELISKDTNDCINSDIGINSEGYSQVGYENRKVLGHRLSWGLSHGIDPFARSLMPEVIMHECDNPSCINPRHLKAGTHIKNMEDMVSKGRHIQQKRGYSPIGRGA